MIAKIQDMTAAAVVVSAMDKGSSSSSTAQKNISTSSDGQQQAYSSNIGDAQLGPSQTVNQAGQVGYGNQQEQEKEEDGKDQALDSMNEEFVSEMTEELNELMSKLNCDLEFQYHKEVDVMSVKMVDKKTKEVIKEYPPEDMVEGMIKAQEWLGAFLDKNA